MKLYTVYLYRETALHVSGCNSIQLYLQRMVFVTQLLLPAALAEEMEQFKLFHDSGR